MKTLLLAAVAALLAVPTMAAEISREDLQKALQKNPDVLMDALKTQKRELYKMIEEAAREEQARRQMEEEAKERAEFEESFKNPKKPVISDKNLSKGPKDAKFVIVEYSDFQCPYCSRAYGTMKALKEKYGNQLRFVYKHLPLNFHPQAMPASQWVQAATLQSPEKAWKLHDAIYENQDKLGEEFLRKKAAEAGLDMARLEKDRQSEAVQALIEADINEGKSFGFSGTPGFLVNGVPVKGAYPIEHFEMVLERIKKG